MRRGGIRTTKDALKYLVMVNEVAGDDWIDPAWFRFGASRDHVEHLEVPAGQERPTVDGHVDLMRSGPQCVAGVGELDRHGGPTRREG
jgi:hypothetical protein